MSGNVMWAARACVVAAIGLLTTGVAYAGDAKTTRIEPRPYYGAVATIEHGVRVLRPLPPTRHVIINPGHRTRLNLSETNIRSETTINSNNRTIIEDRRDGFGNPGLFVGGFRGLRGSGAGVGFAVRVDFAERVPSVAVAVAAIAPRCADRDGEASYAGDDGATKVV
ncbi:MAG: hypothetical protein AAGG99_04260 [Pseudomonadota bacterium]